MEYQTGFEQGRYHRDKKFIQEILDIPHGTLCYHEDNRYYCLRQNPYYYLLYRKNQVVEKLEKFFMPGPKYVYERKTTAFPDQLEDSVKTIAPKASEARIVAYWARLVSVLRGYYRKCGWNTKPA